MLTSTDTDLIIQLLSNVFMKMKLIKLMLRV